MKHGLRFAAAATVVLALAACRAPAGGHEGQAASPMELKIYAVPAAQTGKLSGALGSVLGGHATITVPAPGKLLVYAPRDAQASIATALESLAKTPPSEAVSAPVNLRFWVVDATAGTGVDDPALKPLSATLDALRHTMGPLHFELRQAAASLAASDHEGLITTTTSAGFPRTVSFKLGAVEGDGVALSLDYKDAGPSGLRQLRTEVAARFGDYLVLAQAPGACPPPRTIPPVPTCTDKPALRLLIVRVDRLNAHA